MNKKQEALRRGLRTFIEDTSRELADLEGRDLHPSAHAAADDGGRVIEAAEAAPPPAIVPRAAESQAAVAPPTREPRPQHPAASSTPPPGAGAQDEPVRPDDLEVRADERSEPSSGPGAPPPIRADGPPRGDLTRRVDRPRPPREQQDGASIPVDRPTRSPRRAPSPVRRPPRPRIAAQIASNGVSAEQAHARKGVCFAYFLNHECWRVPDAYCISALQVCITRECPVYHLHKDALERRFARKFKHFW